MIKLYNKTCYNDVVLKTIFSYAQRHMKVKGEVIVKVTHGYGRAKAFNVFPYLWHLTKKRCPKSQRDRLIGKDAGWIEMNIPQPEWPCWKLSDTDLIYMEWFVNAAMHEMAHIKDYREGRFFSDYQGRGKRLPHHQRPSEISAENHCYNRKPKTKKEHNIHDEMILLLALEIEEKKANTGR